LNDIFSCSQLFEIELKMFAGYNARQVHKIISINSLKNLTITCNDYASENTIKPCDTEDKYKFNYFPNSLISLSVFDFDNLSFLPNKIKKIKIGKIDKVILKKIIKKVPFKLNYIESFNANELIKFGDKKIVVQGKTQNKIIML